MSEIINWYDVIPKEFLNNTENPNVGYHNLKVPFYGLISGSSGSGKTQMLLSIIKAFSDKSKNKKKVGTFFDVWIFVKSADEPIYRWIKTLSPNIHILEDISKLNIDKDFDVDLNHLLGPQQHFCKEKNNFLVAYLLIIFSNLNAFSNYPILELG